MSAKNEAFERASELLTRRTPLTRPQARGTIRLALKDGGFDFHEVTPRELAVLFKMMMPKRLEAQGIDSDLASTVCQEVSAAIGGLAVNGQSTAAARMFDRLDKA